MMFDAADRELARAEMADWARSRPIDPVAEYDAQERAALDRLPNRIVEAARTVVYDHLGYPGRVTNVRQLWKYADAMQEARTRLNYDILGGLTEQEFKLVCAITGRVANITTAHCDRTVTPASSLLRAVIAYRAIKALDPQPKTVLEFGPGSGYLGYMLMDDGFTYHAVENCQAFYLWQQMLFGEWGHSIPWWDWFTQPAPEADLYVANHTLNEMHPTALKYAVHWAPGLWIVENFGGQVTSTDQATRAVFRAAGYHETNRYNCAIMHKGREPKFEEYRKYTRNWDDLLELWGGSVPMTEDERFWEAC